ncbi:MAG: CsgE family curli-type amyloid fiber assembly protein [Polyangiaceae bacterium]
MKAMIATSLLLLLTFTYTAAHAASTNTAGNPDAAILAGSADSLEKLTTLESPRQTWLLDHTNTGLGGEFFRAFASRWREQDAGALVISVQETQATFFGHQISIWAGDRLLLQTRFYPSQRSAMSSIAEGMATAAAERLAQWQARGVPQP